MEKQKLEEPIFNIKKIKDQLGSKISFDVGNSFIDGFLEHIFTPIIRRILFAIYKQEYQILEKAETSQKLSEEFKKLIFKHSNLKDKIYEIIESLLRFDNYGNRFIQQYILSELSFYLTDTPKTSEINQEYFDSKEFQYLVETHFALSLQIVKSILALEEHFTNSAESLSKILISDSLKKGELYETYIKNKFSLLQENLEDKLGTLIRKKEKELLDLVNESKDVLDSTKRESDIFLQRSENYFSEKEMEFKQWYAKFKQELFNIQKETEITFIRLKEENQGYKDELEKLKKSNSKITIRYYRKRELRNKKKELKKLRTEYEKNWNDIDKKQKKIKEDTLKLTNIALTHNTRNNRVMQFFKFVAFLSILTIIISFDELGNYLIDLFPILNSYFNYFTSFIMILLISIIYWLNEVSAKIHTERNIDDLKVSRLNDEYDYLENEKEKLDKTYKYYQEILESSINKSSKF
ncbi:MAG: hypothetical protein H7A23_07145 [Leptospiraceae bacterium]|nr:hypothetical protein [Leptospiraceae bacterium]